MRNSILLGILIAVVIMISLSGCARLREEAEFLKNATANDTEGDAVSGDAFEGAPEPISDERVDGPADDVGETPEDEEDVDDGSADEGPESYEAKKSGSLDLQSDLDLCPHLKRKFSCDKYALKVCPRELFGFAQFVPDQVTCKTSAVSGNEICVLKECGPIADDGGVVRARGGVFARAEYSYIKTSESSQVSYDYSLVRCGEMKKEFDTQDDCWVWFGE